MRQAHAALYMLYIHSDSSASPSGMSGMTEEKRKGAREAARKAAEAARGAEYATKEHQTSALNYGAILEDEHDTKRASEAERGPLQRLSLAAQHPAYEWYTAAARAPAHLTDALLRLAAIEESVASVASVASDGAVQIAQKLRLEAANQGDDRAHFLVGARLDVPTATESQEPKHATETRKKQAGRMFRMAAKKGNVGAMLALILRDPQNGEKWCQLAIAEGSAEASFEYGRIMMERQKFDQARTLFVTAADFGVTKAHNLADDAAEHLNPARVARIDIEVLPTSTRSIGGYKEHAVIVEPAEPGATRIAREITAEAGAAYERTGPAGGGAIHVASPLLPSTDDPVDRKTAVDRLTKAYTNVFIEFVLFAGSEPSERYKLRLCPIVLERDRPLWGDPRLTADAIRRAVRDVPDIASFISKGDVTMHVFEGYSAVLDYKAAFGLLDNSDANSHAYGRARPNTIHPFIARELPTNAKAKKWKKKHSKRALEAPVQA
jgi:TPR repeat protein